MSNKDLPVLRSLCDENEAKSILNREPLKPRHMELIYGWQYFFFYASVFLLISKRLNLFSLVYNEQLIHDVMMSYNSQSVTAQSIKNKTLLER